MGLTKTKALLLMMAVIIEVSLGGVHKVGDSAGWTVTANASYYHNWASNNNFHVGDVIVFEYNNQFANLKQVSHQDFESCNATSPIAAYNSGSDSITLKRSGHYYFLCGFRGHCQAGQKVDILVIPGPASMIRRLGSTNASSSVATNGAATSTSTPSSTPSTLMPPTPPLYSHCASSQGHHTIKVMFKLILANTVLIALIFLGCSCHHVRVSTA